MKLSFLPVAATIIALLSFKTNTAPSTWTLDSPHSNLEFSISLFGLSDIKGTFKMKEARITAPKDDFSDAVVNMSADVSSVNTGEPERDKHLQTADFFDAAKYPTITFKSNSFKKVDAKNYKVTGDLTFHGVTKTVTLDAQAGTATHPVTKKELAGFRVKGTIKRLEFGISPTSPTTMLDDDVKIEANLQFTKD